MSFEAARAAIQSCIEAGFTATPLFFANDTLVPPDPPGPWTWVQVLGGENKMRGVGKPGERLFVHGGVVLAHVLVPVGTGDTLAGELCGALALLLQRIELATTLPDSVVRTKDPRESGGRVDPDFAGYYRLTTVVNFDLYYTG
jgi:hypothetical protein